MGAEGWTLEDSLVRQRVRAACFPPAVRAFDPFLYFCLGTSVRKTRAGSQSASAGQALDICAAGTDPAAAGGTEGNNDFPTKIIALQKSADDTRGLAVPDGVAQKQDAAVLHFPHLTGNCRPGAGVILLRLGTAGGIAVV